MSERTREPRPVTRLSRVGRWFCLAGATFGAVTLFGWMAGSRFLTALIPGQPRMMPNTSVGLMLAGLAGALLYDEERGRTRRVLCMVAALIVAAIGVGTIAEYALHIDLHIDQLLMRANTGSHPGRPAPPTGVALAFLALAILLFDVRPNALARPSDWLIISAALAGLVGLTGQILGNGLLYPLPIPTMAGVAVPTALSLVLLSIGLLLARPNAGIMAVITSRGYGGMMIRRLGIPTVLIPIAVGLIGVRLFTSARLNDFPLMVATLAVAMIVVGLALLMITALLLNRSYDALVATQARTRDIIAHASDGIFIADLNGRYLEVNSAGCQLLGVSANEIVGRSIRDFILPDEAERLAHVREELLRGGSQTAEWHLRHTSGRYIPVEVSTKILPGGMWEGLVRDISRRKAAEEQARRELAERQRLEQQLREARSFLENVLQSSVEYGLIALDLDRRILFWNEGARRMFGYSTQEMVGASADALHVESDITSGEAPALYARALDEGSAEATQRRRRRDGSEFLSRVMVTRRTSADGTPSGYLLVSRDVTREHREAEHDRLLASIGLLLTSSLDRRQVVEGAADLLVREFADACVVDIADRPEADVQAWTSRVAHRDSRMRPLTSALEKIRRDGVHPYFAVAPLEARRTTVVSHVTDEFLDSLARSDEHRRLIHELSPASLISVPLQARGLLLGVITFVSADAKRRYDEADAAFVEEIGQRLALALDNARLFEAATHAIAARDDVMRVVAHDLRNPLSTILMQASSLRSKEPESEGSPGRGESIERAARRMNRLIQDLLDVTRLETGQLSIKQASESARAIVMDSVDAQRELAASASLELRADVPTTLPNVWADRDRVLQVLENLIGNSTKFTQPRGQIVAGAAPHDAEVLFWVRDTGRGIPAEDLPHVFDRFWQARKDRSDGTGLGLPIVKGLVEAQGGRVWAESAPGRGSTFYFTVPMTRSAKPTRDRRRPNGSRKTAGKARH